ncbi:MAG: hypothetical protein ACJ8FS_17150 [Sphingomicrobium sp.]
MPRNLFKPDNRSPPATRSRRLAAAAEPDRSTTDRIGNFGNLEDLFAQLEQPQVIELGNPLPRPKYLPRTRVGRCPAAHNQALLGADLD